MGWFVGLLVGGSVVCLEVDVLFEQNSGRGMSGYESKNSSRESCFSLGDMYSPLCQFCCLTTSSQ